MSLPLLSASECPAAARELRSLPDAETVLRLRRWFNGYMKSFDDKRAEYRRNYEIKREHSRRVAAEIVELAEEMGLNRGQRNLAEVIALFHDLGRFEQYRRYRTFSDRRSENHAELGVRILAGSGVLGQLAEGAQAIVLRAIADHNRPLLSRRCSPARLFYSRLLRDADKLDIWRVVTAYYRRRGGKRNPALELELPDTPGFSLEVVRKLRNGRPIDARLVKNLNDLKLLQAGWVFDINFAPTRKRIRERRILEAIRTALPDSSVLDELFSMIRGACSS